MRHAALLFLLASCGGTEPPEETTANIPPNMVDILEARAQFPLVLTMHHEIFAKTCASTAGVCHNSKEYPDLHTPGNLMAIISGECNADKEPSLIFDGCEPPGDVLALDDGSWSTEIAWLGTEEWNETDRSLYRRVVLADPPPREISREPAHILRGDVEITTLPHHLTIQSGASIGEIHDLFELDFEALTRVRGGDPNHDGHLGAGDGWRLVTPRRPNRSYLLARLHGDVPGTRMPPLQMTLSNAELIAITCWIETLDDSPSTLDPIDYDHCLSVW